MNSIQEVRSLLSDTAERLAGEIDLPVSVRFICDCLNVRIRRCPELKSPVLVNANNAPEVHLPPSPRSTSSASMKSKSHAENPAAPRQNRSEPWERYVVAHELGHYVLHRARQGKPLGKSEYWIHEELCDCFARWLLLPQKAIDKSFARKLAVLPHLSPEASARCLLAISKELQAAARVPWSIAAMRLTEYSEHFAFLSVRDHDKMRLRVDSSTLDRRKEIGRLIQKSSELGQMLSSTDPKTEVVSIPPELFAGFHSRSIISAVAAKRAAPARWHLALSLSSPA
jgi:IrrE N-terminal-like domain